MSENTNDLAKIANLLALIVVKGESKGSAAITLSACGFSNKEISALTGSSESSIRGFISQGKRKQADG